MSVKAEAERLIPNRLWSLELTHCSWLPETLGTPGYPRVSLGAYLKA